jgi:uncharacterized membrane protein YraQ (UPF0718 family)
MEVVIVKLREVFVSFSGMLLRFAPFWLLGIATGALIAQFIPFESIRRVRWLGGFSGVVAGTIAGALFPAGLYGGIPLAVALSASGVPVHALMSFLITTPLISPNLLVYTAGLIGPRMAAARLVGALCIGIAGGGAAWLLSRSARTPGDPARLFLSGGLAGDVESRAASTVVLYGRRSLKLFLEDFARYARFSGKYFVLAVVLSSWIDVLVPKDWIVGLLGARSALAVVAATVLSVPMYVCGGNTIPLINKLMESGMTEGAALAFFIAGPATKAGNVAALAAVFGSRGVALFVTCAVTFSIAAGYVYDGLGRLLGWGG